MQITFICHLVFSSLAFSPTLPGAATYAHHCVGSSESTNVFEYEGLFLRELTDTSDVNLGEIWQGSARSLGLIKFVESDSLESGYNNGYYLPQLGPIISANDTIFRCTMDEAIALLDFFDSDSIVEKVICYKEWHKTSMDKFRMTYCGLTYSKEKLRIRYVYGGETEVYIPNLSDSDKQEVLVPKTVPVYRVFSVERITDK